MRHVLHLQQRSTTCAVASIRTVLHHQFGLRVSEAALVVLGTHARKPLVTHGSNTSDMRRMVQGASKAYHVGTPWKLRTSRNGTISKLTKELAAGRWPIVQVYHSELQEYHAVVVTELTETHVRVFDPDYSRTTNLRWMTRDAFEAWWICPATHDTWYAVVIGDRFEAPRTHA